MDNAALMRGLYDAYLVGDLDAVLAGFDPEIELQTVGRREDHPAFGRRSGHQGFRDFVQTLSHSHRIDRFDVDHLYAAKDKVFVTGHVGVTFLDSGLSADSPFVHVWTIRDGKAVGYQEFVDTASIVAAYRG